MRRRGTAQAVAFTWERDTLRLRPAGRPQGLRWCGRLGVEAGAHRVGKVQLPSLCLEHDVEAAALEVCAVRSTGDLDRRVG